jgi:hypothetical protein
MTLRAWTPHRGLIGSSARESRQIRASRSGRGQLSETSKCRHDAWLPSAATCAEELSARRVRGCGVGPSSGGCPGDEDQAAAVDPAHGDRFGGSVRNPRRPAHR